MLSVVGMGTQNKTLTCLSKALEMEAGNNFQIKISFGQVFKFCFETSGSHLGSFDKVSVSKQLLVSEVNASTTRHLIKHVFDSNVEEEIPFSLLFIENTTFVFKFGCFDYLE